MSHPDPRVVAAYQEKCGYSHEDARRAATALINALAHGIEQGGNVGFISAEGTEVRIEVLCIEEIV